MPTMPIAQICPVHNFGMHGSVSNSQMASLPLGSPVPKTPPVPNGLEAIPKSPPANATTQMIADDRRRRIITTPLQHAIAACMPIIDWLLDIGSYVTPYQHARHNVPDSMTTPTPQEIRDALADSLNLPTGTFTKYAIESATWAQLRNYLVALNKFEHCRNNLRPEHRNYLADHNPFEHCRNNLSFEHVMFEPHVQTSKNDVGGSIESSDDSQASTLIMGGGTWSTDDVEGAYLEGDLL